MPHQEVDDDMEVEKNHWVNGTMQIKTELSQPVKRC
jgi:hypothetical protein